jgi:hypothetical protein
VGDGRANHRLGRIALITYFMLKVVRRRGTFSAGRVLILHSAHACRQPGTAGVRSGAIGSVGWRLMSGVWM